MKLKPTANKLCQKALEYYSKGNCKKLLNNYKGAIADFTKAIEYNPNFAEAYYRRANAKLIINDASGAKSDYYKAIELDSRFIEPLLNSSPKNDLAEGRNFTKMGHPGIVNTFSLGKEL